MSDLADDVEKNANSSEKRSANENQDVVIVRPAKSQK